MKRNYDIEIASNSQISGGYLTTTAPMTEKQVIEFCEREGRNLLRYSKGLTGASYWVGYKEDKDFEDMLHVSLFKVGRKVCVSATKNGNEVYQNF